MNSNHTYPIILLLIFICFQCSLKAQEGGFKLKDSPLNISYFGHDIVHPGLKVGTELHVYNWTKKKNNGKERFKSLFLSPQIGLNFHIQNHTALLFNLELGFQKKYVNGWFHSTSFGFGNLMHINWGKTYELQDDGSIDEKKIASRSYLLPNLNLEIGKKVNKKLAVFGKFTSAARLNYNTVSFIPQLYWELGGKLSL